MKRGRPSKYLHLLKAMRAGDVLYLPATAPRFDRQISGAVYLHDGSASTKNFIAVLGDAAKAHRIVRITMHKPMRPK
jgi:hypothetical protein